MELERDIKHEMEAMIHAKNNEDRLQHWETMKDLISMRSEETIRKMEIERGLR